MLQRENIDLAILHDQLIKAKVDYQFQLPGTYLLNKATTCLKKIRPIRGVIIMFSFILSEFLAIVLLLIIENVNFKRMKA